MDELEKYIKELKERVDYLYNDSIYEWGHIRASELEGVIERLEAIKGGGIPFTKL